MMRPVARAFSTNDKEKNDRANERYKLSSFSACGSESDPKKILGTTSPRFTTDITSRGAH